MTAALSRTACTAAGPAGAQAPRRGAGRLAHLTPGPALGLGVAMIWFSLLVLIPLAAVVVTAAGGGWDGFVDTLTNPQTLAAVRLTVVPVAAGHRWSTW